MNPQEFYEKMLELSKQEDPEMSHIKMDNLMCETLKSIGYENGIQVFEDSDKWYS